MDAAPWAVEDRPRFPHRGIMIDTSRHFEPLAVIRGVVDALPYSQSHIEIKMAQHLDLRCVLLSDPSTLGAGGPNQNTSRIQHKGV